MEIRSPRAYDQSRQKGFAVIKAGLFEAIRCDPGQADNRVPL